MFQCSKCPSFLSEALRIVKQKFLKISGKNYRMQLVEKQSVVGAYAYPSRRILSSKKSSGYAGLPGMAAPQALQLGFHQ